MTDSSSLLIARLAANRKRLLAVLALALVAYHLAAIAAFAVATIDGERYFLIDDDPMISLRYARHLAAGHGLVYNLGERVEGFSNPLLTLIAAGLHLLPISAAKLGLAVQLVNLLASLVILWLLGRFWGDEPRQVVAGLISAALYVALPAHAYHAHAGYDAYLLTALLCLGLVSLPCLEPRTATVVGLLPLAHGLGLQMLAVFGGLFLLLDRRPVGQRLRIAVFLGLPFAAYLTFRLAYFQAPLPNTYYLKVGAGSWHAGVEYVRSYLETVVPLVSLGILGVLSALLCSFRGLGTAGGVQQRARAQEKDEAGLPSRRVVAVVVMGAALGFAVAGLGGDVLPQYRFLFPASVLLAALGGLGLARCANSLGSVQRMSLRTAACLALTVAFLYTMSIVPLRAWGDNSRRFEAYRRWNVRHVAMGLALAENTPSGALVALFGLGHTGYHSQRRVLDMLGKVDAHIARRQPIAGRQIGHNKSDADYVLAQEPAVVEMHYKDEQLADPTFLEKERAGKWGYGGELALTPRFRQQYLPHRVIDRQQRPLPFLARPGVGHHGWHMPPAYFDHL